MENKIQSIIDDLKKGGLFFNQIITFKTSKEGYDKAKPVIKHHLDCFRCIEYLDADHSFVWTIVHLNNPEHIRARLRKMNIDFTEIESALNEVTEGTIKLYALSFRLGITLSIVLPKICGIDKIDKFEERCLELYGDDKITEMDINELFGEKGDLITARAMSCLDKNTNEELTSYINREIKDPIAMQRWGVSNRDIADWAKKNNKKLTLRAWAITDNSLSVQHPPQLYELTVSSFKEGSDFLQKWGDNGHATGISVVGVQEQNDCYCRCK